MNLPENRPGRNFCFERVSKMSGRNPVTTLLVILTSFYLFIINWFIVRCFSLTSLVAQMVKRLPTMQETCNLWVRKISWRRKWQPTPVFLSGKSHGRRNLVGYSPWVAKSRTRLSDFTFTSVYLTRGMRGVQK